MNQKKLNNFVFVIFSIFIFVWVFNFFNGEEAINYILNLEYKLLIVVLVHIPTLFFDSLAWRFLLTSNKLSFTSCFFITWISQTASKVIPVGAITGEFIRIYLGIKKGLSASESSSTVMLDLALASFSLLLIVIFCSSVLFFSTETIIFTTNIFYLFFAILLLLIFSIIFAFLIRKRFILVLVKKFRKKNFFKIDKKKILYLLRFDFQLFKLSFKLEKLFLILFLKIIGWLAGAFEIYIFFFVIGVEVDFVDVLIIESFASIIKSVAFFIPAGIGVQELAFVIAGDYVGLSSSLALSAAIGRRIREFAFGLPVVSYFFLNKKNLNFD